MPSIANLIEYADPIETGAPCGAAITLFANNSELELLGVVEDGRPTGAVVRGQVRAEDADRPVRELMQPLLAVDPDIELDQACALLLDQGAGVAGLVVADDGRYCGVIPARAVLRAMSENSTAAEDNRRFVEMVSHEVRAPLNGVLAVAELLQRQALSTDSHAHVRTIIESSHATLRALNDALELSHAETGALELEAADALLRDVMDQVQSTWQERAAQDGVTLLVAYDGDPGLSAHIDASRVKQVFDKLIDAALTLSRRGAVEASLQAQRGPDGSVQLTGRVRDTGGGLSAARLAKVFSDQGREASAGAAYAGLGLMLCRRIIERMDGQIRADSNVGAGATIVFEFSAPETVVEAEAAELAVRAGARSAHILVVDDNATNRMVAEALCEMFDCTSECVEDGEEAVEAARSARFDLILMDIRMPRMDGLQATRLIRQLPGTAGEVPIIALTANADPEDAASYIACGMHEVVEKPIKPERLLEAINSALSAVAPDQSAAAAA